MPVANKVATPGGVLLLVFFPAGTAVTSIHAASSAAINVPAYTRPIAVSDATLFSRPGEAGAGASYTAYSDDYQRVEAEARLDGEVRPAREITLDWEL